jgi:hypothetical protein
MVVVSLLNYILLVNNDIFNAYMCQKFSFQGVALLERGLHNDMVGDKCKYKGSSSYSQNSSAVGYESPHGQLERGTLWLQNKSE